MTNIYAPSNAPSIPPSTARGNAQAIPFEQCTDGRTDGRTNEDITHVRHKSLRTDTCARVQNRNGWMRA